MDMNHLLELSKNEQNYLKYLQWYITAEYWHFQNFSIIQDMLNWRENMDSTFPGEFRWTHKTTTYLTRWYTENYCNTKL